MATQAAAGDPRATAEPPTGLWREAFGRLRKNKLAMVGLIAVITLFVIAIIGPYIAPYPVHGAGPQGRRRERRPAAAAAAARATSSAPTRSGATCSAGSSTGRGSA